MLSAQSQQPRAAFSLQSRLLLSSHKNYPPISSFSPLYLPASIVKQQISQNCRASNRYLPSTLIAREILRPISNHDPLAVYSPSSNQKRAPVTACPLFAIIKRRISVSVFRRNHRTRTCAPIPLGSDRYHQVRHSHSPLHKSCPHGKRDSPLPAVPVLLVYLEPSKSHSFAAKP